MTSRAPLGKGCIVEMTGDESAFYQSSLLFVRQARKLEVLAQTQSFFSGQQHSSPPPPPTPCPFGEECCVTLRAEAKTAAWETSKWVAKSGAKTRAKASERVPLIVALDKQNRQLRRSCFFLLYVSDNFVFQEMKKFWNSCCNFFYSSDGETCLYSRTFK